MLDAAEKIMPGFIDHACPAKADLKIRRYRNGYRAARHGRVYCRGVYVAEPACDTDAVVAGILEARKKAWVRVYPIGAVPRAGQGKSSPRWEK